MRHSERRNALASRLFGEVPSPDAPPVERLRWLRRWNLRFAPFGVVAWGLCVGFIHEALVYALAGVWAAWVLISHLRLTRRIGRER